MRDDAALLERIGAGDRNAFRELVAGMGPHGLALATRVTGNPALAEEAVQEALCDVWLKAGRYDARRGGARQWVLSLVHNKAVDAVRRERSVTRVAELTPEPVPADDPEEQGWMADRRTRVLRALNDLSAAQREAIMLAYFAGLTYRQVADELGIPEGTAKSRLRDGLLTMRGLLERHGVGWGAEQ